MPLRFPYGDTPQTAFPLGGIGAGTICLNSTGGLQDFSIRHRPHTTAEPENLSNISAGFETALTAFATLRIQGEPASARVLEGPIPDAKVWCFGLKGQGYRMGGYEGLPRLQRTDFSASFPFAEVALIDDRLPVGITLTAFSPFVPGDDRASGMPAAVLEYQFSNPGSDPIDLEFGYHLSHLARPSADLEPPAARNRVIPGRGILFSTENDDTEIATGGSASLTMLTGTPLIKARWFRGGWFDAISLLWKEIQAGSFTENDGSAPARQIGRNGGSLFIRFTIAPGQATTIPVAITWHFPRCSQTAGPCPEESCGQLERPDWKPFYAGLWHDAAAVADEIYRCYGELRERSLRFRDCLERSSLPETALEAISANLGILRSPSILRLEDGRIWGWEGCFDNSGCCHGSCTHVWNYAQAMAHLFPALERTLRSLEYKSSMDDRGHINFRSALPPGPVVHHLHAAADGQLGGIIKLYRDWRICGDEAWLRSLYPLARQAFFFAVDQWDPDREGWIREPHHNTYDIEFWGPDGMHAMFYRTALAAMHGMAAAVGDADTVKICATLSAAAEHRIKNELFNGEYLMQLTQWEGLRDNHFLESLPEVDQCSPEEAALLRAEGPKYQYGTGCLSDSVLGTWMGHLCGLEFPTLDTVIRSTLQAVYQHNFRDSFEGHTNTQRPGYALHQEGGLLVCTWPRGGRPSIPFPYSDEVFTGIEYQVASHLILLGYEQEGVSIVNKVRARYEGRVRNPFCEYECGNYYIRALSSFALLQAFSGFRYDAVTRELILAPAPSLEDSGEVFFATEQAWGVASWTAASVRLEIAEGELPVERVSLIRKSGASNQAWEGLWLATPAELVTLA